MKHKSIAGKKLILIVSIGIALLIAILVLIPEAALIEKKILKNKAVHNTDYHHIIKTKSIRIITHNNSTSYFLYRGQPMGFHYDLAKAFAKAHGFKLKIIVEDDFPKAIKMLKDKEADIVAMDITITKDREKDIQFTYPIGSNKQVLVQRKRYGRRRNDSALYIKTVMDLSGKKIYVQRGTIFKENLEHLKNISATNFQIVEDSIHSMEELIMMVANNKIDYTACDERIAKANATYNPTIDYHLALSIEQKLAWAIPQNEDSLLIMINQWLKKYTRSRQFALLENKYFKTKKNSFYTDKQYIPLRGGQLSPYDQSIKENAKSIGWDWRLLAAVIYNESRFNAMATSWAGAKGLMQLMPKPAVKFNLDNPYNPKENIRAGAKYLHYLTTKFTKPAIDSISRIKFALAAYNIGLGHVRDAQKLAKKYTGSDTSWSHGVDTFLVLKSKPKYYKDSVVKYGYCRGKSAYNYVENIFTLYDNYKNLVTK